MMKLKQRKLHCNFKKIIFRSTFENTTILRANLVYGTNSYLVRFLTQNWQEDYSPFESVPFKHFRFHPM